MGNGNYNPTDRLEQATADRLRRLQSMPVETANLAAKLRLAIPELQAERGQEESIRRSVWQRWGGSLRAAAAILVVIGTIFAVLLAGSGSTVMASVNDLAAVHESAVAGRDGHVDVGSVKAAEAELSKQWPQQPGLPDLPPEKIVACSVHEIARRKLALVRLQVDGQPVTVAVAKSSEIKCPMGEHVMRDGLQFCVHSTRGINMVMVEKAGQWTCFMGKVPSERLIDLAMKSAEPHNH